MTDIAALNCADHLRCGSARRYGTCKGRQRRHIAQIFRAVKVEGSQTHGIAIRRAQEANIQ